MTETTATPTSADRLREDRESFAAGVLEFVAVLGLFEGLAYSSLGVRALRELGPRSEDDARAALARVAEMRRLFEEKDPPSLAGVCDPLPGDALENRVFDEERCVALRNFLDSCGRIQEWFQPRGEEVPELAAIAERVPDVTGLRDRIDAVVDERGRVRRDATELLARLARTISDLERQIDARLRAVLKRGDVKSVLSDVAVHRRGSRPVLAVKAKSAGRVKGIVHDRSQSGESVFVEPREVIEFGNALAEAQADERREIDRVLLELLQFIRERAPTILRAAVLIGEIELAMISARYAEEYRARPALLPGQPNAAPSLLLRGARHPLLMDQVARGQIDEVVPIDVRLGDEFDMLIITGPNTGGKTLALKTTGLVALMTRAGLPVPCSDGTTVPLYDRIVADIGDEQEISQNLSTFASHLVRIKRGLETATASSLVLLDELGGGTDPDEGAALGEAVLDTLLDRGVPTMVSTHIGKLKEFAYRRPRAENACTEFDLETLAPRYKLHVGTPGESGALVIARRLGLPDAVVDLALERTERRDGELAELMEDVREARLEAEKVKSRAESHLESAEEERRVLATEKAELDRRGEQLEAEAQRGIEERVRDAMRQLERARTVLSQLPKEAAAAMVERLDALEYDLTGASLSDRRSSFLTGLSKGSLVYVPRYRQRVLVHRIDRAKREVTVKLGSMKMKVSFDEVTPYESL